MNSKWVNLVVLLVILLVGSGAAYLAVNAWPLVTGKFEVYAIRAELEKEGEKVAVLLSTINDEEKWVTSREEQAMIELAGATASEAYELFLEADESTEYGLAAEARESLKKGRAKLKEAEELLRQFQTKRFI